MLQPEIDGASAEASSIRRNQSHSGEDSFLWKFKTSNNQNKPPKPHSKINDTPETRETQKQHTWPLSLESLGSSILRKSVSRCSPNEKTRPKELSKTNWALSPEYASRSLRTVMHFRTLLRRRVKTQRWS